MSLRLWPRDAMAALLRPFSLVKFRDAAQRPGILWLLPCFQHDPLLPEVSSLPRQARGHAEALRRVSPGD